MAFQQGRKEVDDWRVPPGYVAGEDERLRTTLDVIFISRDVA